MKRLALKIILLVVIAFLFALPQLSFACNYTFNVSLVSHTTLDPVRSTAKTLGFDNWYIWKYKVDVIAGSDRGHALSNWVLELPDCYIASPELFKEIEASATRQSVGDNGKIRVYEVNDENDKDGEDDDEDELPKISGLKWDQISGDELDHVGEWAEFSFSAPTNLSIETDWSVKAGSEHSGGGNIFGTVQGPACPECHPSSVIPEPLSLVLFGTGLFGVGLLKRRWMKL